MGWREGSAGEERGRGGEEEEEEEEEEKEQEDIHYFHISPTAIVLKR